MKNSNTALYSLLWISYLAFTFVLFPTVNISCVIPVIPIIGLGAWLFGTSAGLKLSLLSLFHNFLLTGIIYADQVTFYQYTLSGYIFLPITSVLTGNLRKRNDEIKSLHQQLEAKVTARNKELSLLTEELLNNSENLKVARGEMLHDGIGQQLTGIQLLSTTLQEQLLKESNPTAAIADHLISKTRQVHLQVRSISRLLFPIRISQTGFSAAIEELTSSIRELKHVHIIVKGAGRMAPASDTESLQLYRIAQETILYAIDHLDATHLSVKLGAASSNSLMQISHNGTAEHTEYMQETEQLLQYRLKRISCTMKRELTPVNTTITVIRSIQHTEAERRSP